MDAHQSQTRASQRKVQLIDATQWFRPLRKNLGKKNCELSDADIKRIGDAFLAFDETEQSKIFSNEAFGYRKVTVERPLRLHSQLSAKAVESLRFASGDAALRADCYDHLGEPLFDDFPSVQSELESLLDHWYSGEDIEDESATRKTLPEKKRKNATAATPRQASLCGCCSASWP
jgi:type I restriction enzyme M protein